eukprot:3589247-Prymnesium_polylepis.1
MSATTAATDVSHTFWGAPNTAANASLVWAVQSLGCPIALIQIGAATNGSGLSTQGRAGGRLGGAGGDGGEDG